MANVTLKVKKKHIREHKINTGIEVLWSETIGLCKKLNIIYNIITCNTETQATGESDMFFTPQTGSFWFFQTLVCFNEVVPKTD